MRRARAITQVFVYGTLLRGQSNHRLLADARFVVAALTAPLYELIDLGTFPAMLDGGSTAVTGELYDVDASTLAALDRLEGHPHFYERRPVELTAGRHADAYLLPRDACAGRARIVGGDWRAVAPQGGSGGPARRGRWEPNCGRAQRPRDEERGSATAQRGRNPAKEAT
jgi:gamma-glutamylcyclotransferase (GGCT)/AIG2-like uncharacterized protein YtfP